MHAKAPNEYASTSEISIICFYQIFHEYRTYRSYKSYVFCFWNCYILAGKLRHKLGAKKLKIGYRWFYWIHLVEQNKGTLIN
jgi:hypothetical protein